MANEYHFRCPHCETTTLVDESMRESLLSEGCVICTGPVSDAAFSPQSSA